ncbi:MAG TPA: efflux RND transporter permease subunit [Vicinamibacterales bacterium]|nr:efflux RND transporter permease subunit [Vicinamibacterales bacterium]
MNPSEIFIRRPIATSLLMVAIAMFGIIAYVELPVSDLPSVEYPTLNVGANLPGGDPNTMATAVASPLERQFTTIAGVDSMVSSSGTGNTNITLQFDLGRNIDSAAVDVQTAIAAVMPMLPATMTSPPSFRKNNPNDSPILFLNLVSETVPLPMLDDFAENIIAPRISMVSGVSQVQVQGTAKYAVRVQIDPDKLHSQGIGLNEISNAITNWNVNLPTGQLSGAARNYTIRAAGQLNNAAEYRPIIVSYRRGLPVRLDQVANVIDSTESTFSAAWFYSKNDKGVPTSQRAISLFVMRQPGTNTIDVTDRVLALLPTFEEQLPPSAHLIVRGDRSKTIRASFEDIKVTMLATLVLVVGVIYLFLHNGSATLIPALALPFSILGTFTVMELLGYSLDNMSMMALILCIGFVVDDAIVMLENIVRHMEAGDSALEAALKGSREIGFTILTMTTSLAAVFIPILFMAGVLGRFFREFAVTITTAILISGLVSITLTPMLCSRFLRVSSLHAKRGLDAMLERGFALLQRAYARSLALVLRHRPAMLVVFVAVLLGTVRMYQIIPTGFIPDQDNDTLFVSLRAAQGTSYYDMSRWLRQISDIVIKNPNVDSFMANIFGGSANNSRVQVQLIPRALRKDTAQQIAQQIQAQTANFAGFRTFVSLPPAIQIGGRRGNQNYSLMLQSLDQNELYAWAPRVEDALNEQVPEIQSVSTDVEMQSPRVDLVIDRDKAAAVGLNATQIENTLSTGFGSTWVSTIYGPSSQYRVLLELAPEYQSHTDALKNIAFKTNSGEMVPLDAVVKYQPSVGPQSINHSGQLPSVSVSFGLKPGISLGQATAHVKEVADRLLPATVTTSFEGSAKVFQESMTNLGLLLFIAIGVVYIVLGALYESYIHPITILSGLPSAGLGALLTLYIFGNELNVYSFVGLILLIGLVKKNAIMQIDFALDAERRLGKSPADAIHEGCLIRFRPIMMTTMAALLGAVPIALGYGAGGEARRPLGLAVVGGLLISQLITLYLTPVVYTYLATLVRTRRIPDTATAAPTVS